MTRTKVRLQTMYFYVLSIIIFTLALLVIEVQPVLRMISSWFFFYCLTEVLTSQIYFSCQSFIKEAIFLVLGLYGYIKYLSAAYPVLWTESTSSLLSFII